MMGVCEVSVREKRKNLKYHWEDDNAEEKSSEERT